MSILTKLVLALVLGSFSQGAWAQEGHLGHGHDKWHKPFYEGLIRKDTKTSCCNLADCRPTSVRQVGESYEVKVDGAWMTVPQSAIQNVTAPDGGAHVCAGAVAGRARCRGLYGGRGAGRAPDPRGLAGGGRHQPGDLLFSHWRREYDVVESFARGAGL